MRHTSRGTAQAPPPFRIAPILEYYGFDAVQEGYGWKPVRCVFHGDSTASGSVNTNEQLYNCHAADCPKGNAVQIVMKQERLPYREAYERAQGIAGVGSRSVRGASSRSGRMAGGARNRSGSRTLRRTWRSA